MSDDIKSKMRCKRTNKARNSKMEKKDFRELYFLCFSCLNIANKKRNLKTKLEAADVLLTSRYLHTKDRLSTVHHLSDDVSESTKSFLA